jgi:hypothetical protein
MINEKFQASVLCPLKFKISCEAVILLYAATLGMPVPCMTTEGVNLAGPGNDDLARRLESLRAGDVAES